MNMKLAMTILVICCLGLLSWVSPVMGQGSCTWSSVGNELADTVAALAVFDEGTGPALYAGGSFSPHGCIAKWDGNTWTFMGPAGSGARLRSYDDGTGMALYVGGSFTSASGFSTFNLIRWDGTSWSGVAQLGTGPTSKVSAMTVFDDGNGPALLVAVNNHSPNSAMIAKWDGSAWAFSALPVLYQVYGLQVFDDGGGDRLFASGGEVRGVVLKRAPSGTWMEITPPDWKFPIWDPWCGCYDYFGTVRCLAVFDDGNGPGLYAAGKFDPHSNIARWTGGISWAPLGSGLNVNGAIVSMAVYDDGSGPALYVGGGFTGRVKRWNGSTWAPLGTGLSDSPKALSVFDDGSGPSLYAGGNFTTAGGITAPNIARWGCPSTSITLTTTQPLGVGNSTYLANANLTPFREYHNIFSLDTCPGGPGTGPHLGMCLTTMPNYTFILDQLQAPLGAPLFHFIAQDSYTIWGGYQIPPMAVDGIVFDYTGGVIGDVSPVTRVVIQ